MAKEITSMTDDYSQWYLDIVKKAGLACNSKVKGCMIIKPYGFAIWEKIRDELDKKFKETGHVNAYFPLLIPKSFLSREAKHVAGFAKECAVVTHHRLKSDPNGDGVIVDPEAKLEEELIIRPTSETVIWDTYKDWIQSYRDLPLLINQWANVVRWEMRTRPFLRTTEFLWQEGHTAHATRKEAEEETITMLNVYADFVQTHMGIPVYKGEKTEHERFAGAEDTYTIEALMQDGRALQSGTSHFLGQNFAKAFDVTFLDEENKEEHVWATSWGVSTRLMGALIMVHSDDAGLVLPPKMAPLQVVIIPVPKKNGAITAEIEKIMAGLKEKGITVKYDNDKKKRPGFKFAEYEMLGVPIRLALGKRDIENGVIEVARRDFPSKDDKKSVPLEGIVDYIENLLDEIQDNLFDRAAKRMKAATHKVDTWEEFEKVIKEGGFAYAHWDGTTATELKIKELTKATTRCYPLEDPFGEEQSEGKCILTGNPSPRRILFARAY